MRKKPSPVTVNGDPDMPRGRWLFLVIGLMLLSMCLSGCAWDSWGRPSSSGGSSSGCGPGCSH